MYFSSELRPPEYRILPFSQGVCGHWCLGAAGGGLWGDRMTVLLARGLLSLSGFTFAFAHWLALGKQHYWCLQSQFTVNLLVER